MKKWQCIVSGLIYVEADGWPDDGIAPGTTSADADSVQVVTHRGSPSKPGAGRSS